MMCTQQVKNRTITGSSKPTSGYTAKIIEIRISKDIYTSVFFAILSTS